MAEGDAILAAMEQNDNEGSNWVGQGTKGE